MGDGQERSALGAHDMRVVITGATGFIGKALCQSLVRDSHEVVALTRSPAKANKDVEQIQAQLWAS